MNLANLIRHDPEFRGVRREHLVEAGRRVRLKDGLRAFVDFLARGLDGHEFSFYVVSAALREVVVSALEGIVHLLRRDDRRAIPVAVANGLVFAAAAWTLFRSKPAGAADTDVR
jgi:hypothetical protein